MCKGTGMTQWGFQSGKSQAEEGYVREVVGDDAGQVVLRPDNEAVCMLNQKAVHYI